MSIPRTPRDVSALTDVLIGKFVGEAHPLRLMLHRLPIHDSVFELFYDRLVYGIALTRCQHLPFDQGGTTHEVLDRTRVLPQHNRCVVVRRLALGFRVYSTKLELLPHL